MSFVTLGYVFWNGKTLQFSNKYGVELLGSS